MRRWLKRLCVVLSLLVSIVSVTFWVRSYSHEEAVNWQFASGRQVSILSQHAHWIFKTVLRTDLAQSGGGFWSYSLEISENEWNFDENFIADNSICNKGGFSVAHGPILLPVYSPNPEIIGAVNIFPATEISLPHWFVALCGLFFPAWVVRSWLRIRRRLKRGQCVKCGYDLRASAERCPECGLVVEEKPQPV